MLRESRRSEVLKESDTSIAEEGDALREQVKKRCKKREERESSVPRLRNENRLCSVRKTVSLQQPTFRPLVLVHAWREKRRKHFRL